MEEGQKQYLPLAGGTLTGNVTCDSGVTIDGTDISAHVADVDAHHTEEAGLEIIIGDGTNEISTGVAGDIEVPYACTIVSAELYADQSGSIVIDIWKDTHANFPPTNDDSITASAPPTLSSADHGQDTTLTGWTKSLSKGDILRFNVDSVTTCTRVTLVLRVTKS